MRECARQALLVAKREPQWGQRTGSDAPATEKLKLLENAEEEVDDVVVNLHRGAVAGVGLTAEGAGEDLQIAPRGVVSPQFLGRFLDVLHQGIDAGQDRSMLGRERIGLGDVRLRSLILPSEAIKDFSMSS